MSNTLRHRYHRLGMAATMVACVFALHSVCHAVQPDAWPQSPGVHHITTEQSPYQCYLYIPQNYAPHTGTGIHLYFHGQNDAASASDFSRWHTTLLEPLNMIGINLVYPDGDNTHQAQQKVRYAISMLKAVIANYYVIPERSIIASYSGGGLLHGMWYTMSRHQDTFYPFALNALYGSNFLTRLDHDTATAWYISVGEEEWNIALPRLGQTQYARAIEVFSHNAHAHTDLYFAVAADKGHTIEEEDVQQVAAMFRRIDMARLPMFDTRAIEDDKLKMYAEMANQGSLHEVVGASGWEDHSIAEPELARRMQHRVVRRLEDLAELAEQLKLTQPRLYGIYRDDIAARLAHTEHAIQDEAQTKQDIDAYKKTWQRFVDILPDIFRAGTPRITAQTADKLTAIQQHTPETTDLWSMIEQIKQLQP